MQKGISQEIIKQLLCSLIGGVKNIVKLLYEIFYLHNSLTEV